MEHRAGRGIGLPLFDLSVMSVSSAKLKFIGLRFLPYRNSKLHTKVASPFLSYYAILSSAKNGKLDDAIISLPNWGYRYRRFWSPLISKDLLEIWNCDHSSILFRNETSRHITAQLIYIWCFNRRIVSQNLKFL